MRKLLFIKIFVRNGAELDQGENPPQTWITFAQNKMIKDFEIKGKGKEGEIDFFVCSDYTYLFFFPF